MPDPAPPADDAAVSGPPADRPGWRGFWAVRGPAGVLCVALLAGFGLAGWLSPSPAGLGTHQQLGLPPCSARVLLGVPCPGCGMTTSFSHFVRGQWASSLKANAGGFVLAVVSALAVVWAAGTAWRGRSAVVRDPVPVLIVGLSLAGTVALGAWGVRLATGDGVGPPDWTPTVAPLPAGPAGRFGG